MTRFAALLAPHVDLRPEVAAALQAGGAVVALETTVIAQGLPWPHNLESAQAMSARVREAGACPAVIGLLGGKLVIGMSDEEVEGFCQPGQEIFKVSRQDLAGVLARKESGATTVSATLIAAQLAGIPCFATGGIGGVHRGAEASFDVSADLLELSRAAVCVVASGAKSILDLPKTLEVLETQGVPVVGYGTQDFPAFYARQSGLSLHQSVSSPEGAAALLAVQRDLGLGGLLIANPVPTAAALPPAELEAWIQQAEAEARGQGVGGKALTPFLLRRLFELSDGRTLAANLALLEANAALAGRIAVAYVGRRQEA